MREPRFKCFSLFQSGRKKHSRLSDRFSSSKQCGNVIQSPPVTGPKNHQKSNSNRPPLQSPPLVALVARPSLSLGIPHWSVSASERSDLDMVTARSTKLEPSAPSTTSRDVVTTEVESGDRGEGSRGARAPVWAPRMGRVMKVKRPVGRGAFGRFQTAWGGGGTS